MPLFAYECKKCGEISELLVRSDEKPACPACGSTRMEKQMSQFAPMSGSSSAAPACEGCCPSAGACSMQGGGCHFN